MDRTNLLFFCTLYMTALSKLAIKLCYELVKIILILVLGLIPELTETVENGIHSLTTSCRFRIPIQITIGAA